MRSLLLTLWILAAIFAGASRAASQPAPRPRQTPPQAAVGKQHAPAPPADPYTPHVPARAIAYQREARILGLFGLFWHLLGLWLLLRTGLSVRFRDMAWGRRAQTDGRTSPPPVAVLLRYYALFVVTMGLWVLPISLLRFRLEHAYGFSNQGIGAFFRDVALNRGIDFAEFPLLWGVYRLMARSPGRWWLWMWAATAPLLFFIIVIQPVAIAPLFNRYTPLAPGPLRDKILALAAKSGITGGRVFVENTSVRTEHVNAYVTGLGPSTRIVLNDTALRLLPEDQILAMVGHEMGHYVEGHIWWGFAIGALGAGAFLWPVSVLLPLLEERRRKSWRTIGVLDLAAMPAIFLAVSLFLLLQSPVESAISRVMEHRADAFGLRVTGLDDATARLMVGFAERDYSDPDPPRWLQFWFGTHPTLKERIAFARSYRAIDR